MLVMPGDEFGDVGSRNPDDVSRSVNCLSPYRSRVQAGAVSGIFEKITWENNLCSPHDGWSSSCPVQVASNFRLIGKDEGAEWTLMQFILAVQVAVDPMREISCLLHPIFNYLARNGRVVVGWVLQCLRGLVIISAD